MTFALAIGTANVTTRSAAAVKKKPSGSNSQQAYLLDGSELPDGYIRFDDRDKIIKVVDRDRIDETLYFDVARLRLFVANSKSLKRLKEMPALGNKQPPGALSWLAVAATGVTAQKQSNREDQNDKVYLLVCPADDNDWKLISTDIAWPKRKQMEIDRAGRFFKVVRRSEVDESLYLNTWGLRFYVGSQADLEKLKQIPTSSDDRITSQDLVRTVFGWRHRYNEPGLEPQRIPVRGEAGRKLGTKDMAFVKAGEFTRTGEFHTSHFVGGKYLRPHKGDKYRVRVASFYIDKYKVTNEDYARFLNDGNPGYAISSPHNEAITRDEEGRFVVNPRQARWPVIWLNWYQAAGYAEWAGKRLPTEAEWEFAATGSEGRKYPWGNEEPDETRVNRSEQPYIPVDSLSASATPEGVVGPMSMAAEWCADFYSDTYYDKAPKSGVMIDPQGPAKGWENRRMFKGWCMAPKSEFFECSKRHARPPLLGSAIGFRCVKSAER